MTRVYSHRSQLGAHRASALDRPRVARKKKPYKILLEAVTQEKKKLHSILTYTVDAPPGYSFVPAGHPDLTEYCKEKCRRRNLDVHIVSAKPKSKQHENPEKISHHVHRIGYHFPNKVIGEACDVLGYYVRHGVYHKSVRNYDSTRLAQSLENHGQRMLLHGRPATETESKTQVRDSVRDLFPKIPEADLSAIITHAFEEGSDRVGSAKELTLARRVQLAVVAHIRHTYTEYDRLLKTVPWIEARTLVEPVSLAKLREWRDEADSDELEETFREVIVIDDDDDDDDNSSDEDFFSEPDQREPSLEIVSSRATARELQDNELENYMRADAHNVSRAPRRTIVLRSMQPDSRSSATVGTLNAHPTEQALRTQARPLPPIVSVRSNQPHPPSLQLAHSRPAEPRPRSSAFENVPRPQHPLQLWEDGRIYNLQPIGQSNSSPSLPHGSGTPRVEFVGSSRTGPLYPQPRYVQAPEPVHSFTSNHPSRLTPAPPSRRPSEQDVVLPSIEREPESNPSPRRIYNPAPVDHPNMAQEHGHILKRKESHVPMYDREDRYWELPSKRLKPAYTHGDMSAPPRLLPAAMPRQVFDYEDVQIRPRLQPPRYKVVDLTSSSPNQPPHSRDRDGHVVPVHPYVPARPYNYSHVPVQPQHSYYEIPAIESSYREQAVHPRTSERYPIREYAPVRIAPHHPRVAAESRATRSGLVYGGYEPRAGAIR